MPNEPLRLALVGTGRVARALAPSLHRHAGRVVAVVGRDADRAAAVAADLPHDTPLATVLRPDAPATGRVLADWWFLAVSDDALPEVDRQLDHLGAYRGASIATHTSGALTGAVLERAGAAGLATASVHPLVSIADPSRTPFDPAGSFFALEGDAPALVATEAWLDKARAHYQRIRAADKPLYHAAATIAANYVVTLLQEALHLMELGGIPPQDALPGLMALMASALRNASALGPAAALTGPIQRGDTGTVQTHLAAISQRDPDLLELYAAVGRRTTALARLQGNAGGAAEVETLLARVLRSADPAPHDILSKRG